MKVNDLKTPFPFVAGVLLALLFASQSIAADANWKGVRSADWNDGIQGNVSNWYNEGKPQPPPGGIARFTVGARRRGVVLSTDLTSVRLLSFPPEAPQFTFTLLANKQLDVEKLLLNGSGFAPHFLLRPGAHLRFRDPGTGATGLAALGTGKAATIKLEDGARVTFEGRANGHNAVIVNAGGTVLYEGTSHAYTMSITNSAKLQRPFSTLRFTGRSTAGKAVLVNQANGTIDFTNTLGPEGSGIIGVGKISNFGTLYVGTRRLNLSETFMQGTGGKPGDLRLAVFRQVNGAVVTTKAASLGGRLLIDVAEPVPGRLYRVIYAAGGRFGKFVSVEATNVTMPHPRAIYRANEVLVSFNP